MHSAFLHFQSFFQHYGLLAVFLLLLLENFGLPLPGELSLLYAGVHMRLYGGYSLLVLILVGAAGSSLGQMTGYALGRYARRWVERTFRTENKVFRRYAAFFARHGGKTILFARFITGLRMLAGLLAGLACMNWRTFILFDICGAFIWVTTIAVAGAQLGRHWRRLLQLLGRVDLILLIVAIALIWFAWHRLRGEHD